MIQPVIEFVEDFCKDKSFNKVLEVGSRDVNGSVKNLITTKEYIGLDLIEGTNVDVVDDAENIPKHWRKGAFDLVICTETLEHVKDPVKIVNNMRNVLKSGGWLLITTPGLHHPQHDWPSDYYRFLASTYTDIFFKDFEDVCVRAKRWEGNDSPLDDAVMGYGRKP